MATSNIADDIARIQDDLAEIVTRDLIAGKVTSVRDAPRIVGIGRAIAKLDSVAGDVIELQEVIEDLADTNPVVRDMGYHCVLCREAPAEWDAMGLSEHSLACPWRRAIEWVEDEEFEAGEALGNPLQASLVRAAVESEAGESVDLVDPDSEGSEQEAGDWLADAGRATLEALIRSRLLPDSGKRYTLLEVCERLGISYEERVAEEE